MACAFNIVQKTVREVAGKHAEEIAFIHVRQDVKIGAIKVVKAIANMVVVRAVAADAKIPVWGLITMVEVAIIIHLRAVVEIVPTIVQAHVAEVVPMGVQAVVQVVQVIAREPVLVTALAHAILDVGVCVEALVKEPVRADVITPVGMRVIDHVGQILPLLEDTLYFKVHHDVFPFSYHYFHQNIWN